MRVRLSTSLPWYGVTYHDGDEVDLPDEVAARYVATRQADPVNTEPEIETAMLQQPTQRGKRYERHQNTKPTS